MTVTAKTEYSFTPTQANCLWISHHNHYLSLHKAPDLKKMEFRDGVTMRTAISEYICNGYRLR